MVQIYHNEELNDITFEIEALDEWKQLASSLGMENQLDFVKNSDSPIPYPHMNQTMIKVFSTLCPTHVDFKKYKKTPIPLDVLKQISLSVNDKHFNRIEIWSDDKTPDPCVVGIVEKTYVYDKKYHSLKNGEGEKMLFDSTEEAKAYCELIGYEVYGTSINNTDYYLIARWADEVKPFADLKKLASERLLEKYGAEIRNQIEESTQALKKLNNNITLYLNGEITEDEVKGMRRW